MDELEFETNLSVKAVYDYNLIKSALEKNDQKAFAELMDRYRDSVYFMLLKMVNNKDDADDLTIEAFGKAFKRLHQYTPTYAFSTWLFKIASNNCIDFIRRKKMNVFSIDKKYENDEGGELNMDIRAEGMDPEENMVKKQKMQHMHAIVEKLKPRYRTLVELRYFEELSYEEIAEKLDLPLGTVKAQLFRAREFLATILKNSPEKL
ncbi:MAG: sigma-70 family RNA polymerase sigma factor [Bacteroidia bacterium]